MKFPGDVNFKFLSGLYEMECVLANLLGSLFFKILN